MFPVFFFSVFKFSFGDIFSAVFIPAEWKHRLSSKSEVLWLDDPRGSGRIFIFSGKLLRWQSFYRLFIGHKVNKRITSFTLQSNLPGMSTCTCLIGQRSTLFRLLAGRPCVCLAPLQSQCLSERSVPPTLCASVMMLCGGLIKNKYWMTVWKVDFDTGSLLKTVPQVNNAGPILRPWSCQLCFNGAYSQTIFHFNE